jgi:serine/threonine protein kinase
VIGQGAFGVVLAAEYRGTRVAIKRVVPDQAKTRNKGGSVVSVSGRSGESNPPSNRDSGEIADPEIGTDPLVASEMNTRESSEDGDPLGSLAEVKKKTMLVRLLPSFFHNDLARSNLNLLGTASGSASTKSVFKRVFRSCDETSRRQQEFIVEMRLLSRLRHPCKLQPFFINSTLFLTHSFVCKIITGITTIMGAVMTGIEPMMVMEYMENGSL